MSKIYQVNALTKEYNKWRITARRANSSAAYVHIYSLIAKITANIDAKRPKVKANGAAITSAWVFMS